MSRDFCDMSGPADCRFEDFALVNAMLPRLYQPHLQGNMSKGRWHRTYIVAFRHADAVARERSVGFTHSHNVKINWQTHLGALNLSNA